MLIEIILILQCVPTGQQWPQGSEHQQLPRKIVHSLLHIRGISLQDQKLSLVERAEQIFSKSYLAARKHLCH